MELPATADICDDHDHEVVVLDPVFRSIGGRHAMAGTAVTLRLFEDKLRKERAMMKRARQQALLLQQQRQAPAPRPAPPALPAPATGR